MKHLNLLLFSLILLASCSELTLPTNESSQEQTKVNVMARAAGDAKLIYPLHVYAFDGNGISRAHQTITSASQSLSLGLPQDADLHIVAISADEDAYDLPANPTAKSPITMRTPKVGNSLATGYATDSPLMMGKADIHTGQGASATLNISLNYSVASITFNFYGLPAENSSVLVNIDNPYSGVNFDGTHPETTATCRVLCTPATATDGTRYCTSGEVYIFPTSGTETIFTISYTHDGEQYSTATYAATLRAGAPYVINGTYKDGAFHLSGAVTPPEWDDPTILDFTMSDGSITDLSGGNTPGGISGDGIPQALATWDGHVVVSAEEDPGTPGTYNALLLSKEEWSGVPSALSESDGYTAADYAEYYSEDNLSGWTIPTEDQARLLNRLYTQSATDFDAVLQAAGADPVMTIDQSGKNVRYLCENAEKTYSFKANTVLAAGKTVKDYHLRLVRTVTIRTR